MKRIVSVQVGPGAAVLRDLGTIERHTEWIELRLDAWLTAGDLAAHEVERFLRELFRRLSRPRIVAIHGAEAFGYYTGSAARRVEYLRAAVEAGADAIDVPHMLAPDLPGMGTRCLRIVSCHRAAGSVAELEIEWTRLRELAGADDLVKLVPQAECAENALALLESLEAASGPRIGFASGIAGAFSRLWAGRYGSSFAYCALPADAGLSQALAGVPTAPGQYASDCFPRLSERGSAVCLGVIGNPARQSRSPELFGALLGELLGASAPCAHYAFFEARSVASFLAAAQSARLPLVGLSVTAPFKQEAFALAHTHSRSAARTRAANTLVLSSQGTQIHADNTDVRGARALLEASTTPGARVVVLGSGGAARAALAAAEDLGLRRAVCARNPDAARELAQAFDAELVPRAGLAGAEYDALVQTTPLGSLAAPGECALIPGELQAGRWYLDAVYRPRDTPLASLAQARGAQHRDGIAWFLAQAQAQWEAWSGPGGALQALSGRELNPDRVRDLLARTLETAGAVHAVVARARPLVLALIGLRASGKSTLSRALAAKLGWSCVDLDAQIEQRHAQVRWPEAVQPVGAILRQLGEPAFRELESAALAEILFHAQASDRPLVLACGGGAIVREENRRLLAAAACCVWLDAPAELLGLRMLADGIERPALLRGEQGEQDPTVELQALDALRRGHYRGLAALHLDASRPVEELVLAIAETLGLKTGRGHAILFPQHRGVEQSGSSSGS